MLSSNGKTYTLLVEVKIVKKIPYKKIVKTRLKTSDSYREVEDKQILLISSNYTP